MKKSFFSRQTLLLGGFVFASSIITSGCSPLKSSPHEQKHQMELTLHEVQTNLDDVRHDLNCYQTEQQILDGRINNQENALLELKRHHLEKQLSKIETLFEQLAQLERNLKNLENVHKSTNDNLQNLVQHANETSAALAQYREKIHELEITIQHQDQKFHDVAKLKGLLETLSSNSTENVQIYRVRSGDSLEKIAKMHHTHVGAIKRLNHLKDDLIVIGQELKVPKN